MFPKKKELEYGSEEKRLAERKARKEKTVELRAQYVTGKKLNEGLNVNKVAIEDNRTDKTEDGYERIKEVIGYKKGNLLQSLELKLLHIFQMLLLK